MSAVENGGRKLPYQTQLGYTKEQIEAIQKLKNSKTDHDKLGLLPGASKSVLLLSFCFFSERRIYGNPLEPQWTLYLASFGSNPDNFACLFHLTPHYHEW